MCLFVADFLVILVSLFVTAKILLFYFLFYAALAGFFAAFLAVFYQTLDANVPKWTLDRSLIGSNPGMEFFSSKSKLSIIKLGYFKVWASDQCHL